MEIREKIAEGKTKEIYRVEPGIVRIVNKNTITAEDGEKKDIISGKARLANNTTSNVFELLNKKGIKTHFIKRVDWDAFLAFELEMIPIEVVVRIKAVGSYLKRNPEVPDGTVLDEPVVEFFYKDDERHDPIIVIEDGKWNLYYAKKPISSESFVETIKPLLSLDEVIYIKSQAVKIFRLIEEAWEDSDVELLDFKIEFGRRKDNGEIVHGDVLGNDEWRIRRKKDGKQLDKQVYRDGGDIEEVRDIYEIVSELTNQWRQ